LTENAFEVVCCLSIVSRIKFSLFLE